MISDTEFSPNKLDVFRCMFIDHQNPDDAKAYPFEVHVDEVPTAQIFGVTDNTFVYRWCRDNLKNPWAMEFEKSDIILDNIIFRFQTLEDATHFRLRF